MSSFLSPNSEGILPEGTLAEGTLPEGTLSEGTLTEKTLPEGTLTLAHNAGDLVLHRIVVDATRPGGSP